MGAFPLLLFINAPISSNGFITLSIGLFDKDESPISFALICNPDIKPIINLIPVPEFPRSKSSNELLKEFFLLWSNTLSSCFSIVAPILLSAFNVEFGSWAFRKPLTFMSQFNRDPKITILWDIDLSPGHITSPLMNFVWCDVKFKTYLLWKT